MKILFLGCSSFTGFHFVSELSKASKNFIFCILTKKINDYDSIRRQRIHILKKKKNIKFFYNTKFGDKNFLKIVKSNNFNIVCLHHAETSNYNDNKKFKYYESIKKNVFNIKSVFRFLHKNSLIIISNTVFQEIKNKKYLPVNNYGKSKSVTYEKIKKICEEYNFRYKSVFITNPWGIYEEKKLNYYLINNWIQNREVVINYPNYIRDNIYIDDLTKSYVKILKSKSKKIDYFPSGYCSSNKEFIEALRKKFEKFFNKKTKVKYVYNLKHNQPILRINGKKIKKKILIKENLRKYFNYYKKLVFKF